MTVLVTGGAGFVGSYVVRDLLASGQRVIVYDAVLNRNALDFVVPERPADDTLILAQGPVTDGWGLLRLCDAYDVDRIVHLASPLTQDVTANPPAGIRDICSGTAAVFEVARTRALRRVVWASSTAVFGARRDYPAGPIANDAPHRPPALYGSCKSLCEVMALTYRDVHGVDSIGLRLSVVYGAGRLRGYMTFPSELIRRAALSEPVEIPIPDQPINWQYVEDVSNMVVHCLEAPTPESIAFNTYGDCRTFREAGEILGELAPESSITFSKEKEPTDLAQRTLQQSAWEYDDTELRQQLNYEPKYPLERGIAAVVASFRSRPGESAVGA